MHSNRMNNTILAELIDKQRNDTISLKKKLSLNDIRRICKYISNSIFDPMNCSIWQGYVTNCDHPEKGIYINFYFGNKKVALHRILYINYVENLSDNEYLKFTCENPGRCCNVTHMKKYSYKRTKSIMKPINEKSNDDSNNNTSLHIEFD